MRANLKSHFQVALPLYLVLFSISPAIWADQAAPALHAVETLIEQERFAEAEAMLEPLVGQAATDTELRFRLGYVQFRMRKLRAARQRFEAIVNSAPPAYNSRYFLGRIALLENQPAEAIRWLAPVVSSRQTIYDAAAQLAAAYQGTGQPRRAIDALRIAIQDAPWDGGLYYRLGRSFQQLGQVEMAKEALAMAAKLKSANASDVQTLMEAARLTEAGKHLEATKLGRGISEKPDADPATLVALGLLWVKSDLPAEALFTFEQAARRDKKHFASQYNFGLALLRAGRGGEALEPLKRAVTLLPQSLDANLTLGLAAVMLQRYADARPSLEAAHRLDSANQRVATLLATAYLRTGAAAEAVGILRTSGAGSATDAPDPSGPLMMVEALNATRQTEAALETAQLTVKRFPEAVTAQMALAQQLARVGRYREAKPAFERVLQLEAGQPEASLGLGDALQRSGDHEAAISAYRLALDYRTTTLAARLGSARSLVSLKRFADARRILEDGLASFAAEASLHQELSRVYARLGLDELAARAAESVKRLRETESKAGERKP
jgi:tetratricopeptide (TPR) repeat protein